MFANRIAIVTGAGSGIGRSVCQHLAKQSASILVADQNLESANQTKSMIDGLGPVVPGDRSQIGRHLVVQVDVSKADSIRQMFEQCSNVFGDEVVPSLLVNCAGITRDGWFVEMSDDDFDRVIDVNLRGTFLATRMFCKKIIDSKVTTKVGGSIVNVSSVSAKVGNIGQANYVASKSAIDGFTRTVAREMGRYNVRCNAVVPGFIETPMVQTIPEKVWKELIKQIPIGRGGKPEEVAEAIGFLLSDRSSYVTGTLLQVSGGFAM